MTNLNSPANGSRHSNADDRQNRLRARTRKPEQRSFSRGHGPGLIHVLTVLVLSGVLLALCGCGTGKTRTRNKPFFTSGSREADQRASQRMAKEEQLSGEGEGAGEKGARAAAPSGEQAAGSGKPAQALRKQTLYERLGGQEGIAAIIEDVTPRLLQDPRINWERNGVTRSRWFHRAPAPGWRATPESVLKLKQHLAQFVGLATGGPAHYEGREMKAVHADMHIANPEFDAAIGDLKASLDKLQIPNQEQKELLAIIESTRPQIVTAR